MTISVLISNFFVSLRSFQKQMRMTEILTARELRRSPGNFLLNLLFVLYLKLDKRLSQLSDKNIKIHKIYLQLRY